MAEENITKKLQKFERYFRSRSFTPHVKKNMVFYFHEIFQEEMMETETGIKWRTKLNSQEESK